MNIEKKIRLFNGVGSWKTYTAEGTIPEIVMSDGPHGLRKQDEEIYSDLNRSKLATCFPTASCIAASWDRSSLATLGKAIALEALKENVNIMLGCGLNIKRSPLCGRNFEYFSEDPFLSGELSASYVEGMQKEGVGACIKHYACNNQEKYRQNSSSNVDKKTLNEIYLRGFEIAVKKSSPVSIMCSYNKINGTYAGQNTYLLNEVLRKNWGFNGIVISDWGACIDAPKCVKAGLDLAMPDSLGYFDNQLKNALATGELQESDLDVVNSRVIKTAETLKEMRTTALARFPENKILVDYGEQHKIALELAENSAVLLQNKGLLPINPQLEKEILVIGELAEFMKFQAGGSSHITTADYPNALESLKNSGFSLDYSKGYFSGFCKRKKVAAKNKPLYNAAISKVQQAKKENKTVIFFCGLTEAFEGEGFDRTDMNLPSEQLSLLQEILKITEKVVVVNFSGAPVDLSCAKNANGILQMYLCGQACGQAVADLITGKANPSGKLAETWPEKVEDTPCFGNFALEQKVINYKERELVGYRWYEGKKLPVQFPFGFGLSYTTFEYTDFRFDAENKTVSVVVKNTGKIPGKEILQVYVERKQKDSYKELRGFEKIPLAAGESKTVTITLDDNAFKVYDVNKSEFITVKGDYEISLGTSIKDIKFSTNILVEGAEYPEYEEEFSETDATLQAGKFTISDSLGDMAEKSFRIKMIVKILTIALIFMNKGKSREDPVVKIAISAVTENPLKSLISTSGGAITYKLANRFVKWANGSRKC